MFTSLKLGRAFGIDVFLHPSWFLLPVLAIVMQPEMNPFFSVAILVAVFTCVVLHEFGHALTARYFGIGTKDITLWPIGGVARLERMSEKPWEQFWIAIGGPAVNVAIAGLLLCFLLPVFVMDSALITSTSVGLFFVYLTLVNLLLVAFNMLPAFPMDGGRVFCAILSMFVGPLWGIRVASTVGVVLAFLLLIYGLTSGQLLLAAIAIFVGLAGQYERLMMEAKYRFERYPREDRFPFGSPFRSEPRDSQVIELNRTGPNSYGPSTPRTSEPTPTPSFFQSSVQVYVWDEKDGVWVHQGKPGLSAN
ncbi:MAG: site-2 protease family protein [Gemmataceae bacterium]